jgi:hypothetical protein
MILDGVGDGVLIFFVLLNNFSNGVRERDGLFSFCFCLIDDDFFLDFIRFFCFDCRSDICVSQSNSVSSGLISFSPLRCAALDFLYKKKKQLIRNKNLYLNLTFFYVLDDVPLLFVMVNVLK